MSVNCALCKNMLWYICILLVWSLHVNAQPLSCKEDSHCSEGYFCDVQTNVCKQCLNCLDYNRLEPYVLEFKVCVESVRSCGPCFHGFVNIFENGAIGKCVSPELLRFESKSYCVYILITAVATGFIIAVLYVYVIRNTNVIDIVPLFTPVSSVVQPSNESVADLTAVHKNPAKRMLHFLKYFNPQQL